MSLDARRTRQGLIANWLAGMIGTLVLAGVVIYFVRSGGLSGMVTDNEKWREYAMIAMVVAIGPALLYLRTFKARLNADEAAVKAGGGVPNPGLRTQLLKSLAIGGALCELPMALGVVQLFFGGEQRWFLGATLVTIALRLSYRPFKRS